MSNLHVYDETNFTPGRWVPVTPGMLTGGAGGGGGGDASAANQLTEIARLEAIRDRMPLSPHAQPLTDSQLRAAAVPTSVASLPLPAGAATEATLAALSAKLPATLGAKTAANSLAVTLSTDGTFAQAFGTTADASAGTDTGANSFVALFKRLLSVKLGDLIAGRSPVDTLGQPTIARQLAVSSTTANQALTSTCRRVTIRARGCPMRYEIGVGAQTASATASHFIDQDERLDLSVPTNANIAAIAIPPWGGSTTGTGSLAITELG